MKLYTIYSFIVILLILLILNNAVAQIQNPHAEIVNRYHVSPNAAEMFRHGNVPVNLSSGRIQYSVPIYTIRVGDFEWPISLDYGYSGLLLEAKPSEVGLGWSFSGSGMILRQVRGLPDDHPHGYWGVSSKRNEVQAFNQPGDMPFHLVKSFVAGEYDAEPDKFVVIAGPLNFNFFISNTGSPGNCSFQAMNVTPSQENTQICFSWNQIEITDANGTKFIFSAKEINQFTSSNILLVDMMPQYTSAWYLTEIRLVTGRSIFFGYQMFDISSISHSETINRTLSPIGEDIEIDCATVAANFNTLYQANEHFKILSHSKSYSTSSIATQVLDGIAWDEGIVQVSRDSQHLPTGVPTINAITIHNINQEFFCQVDLSYDTTQARSLLSKVVKNSDEVFSFEYNPVHIPYITEPYTGGPFNTNSQNPYAQDFWGFANGKNNPSSIPEMGGNRNPSFYKTKQGALTKINYPTGGSTLINYEPNYVKVNINDLLRFEPEEPNFNFQFQIVEPPLNENVSGSRTITFTKPTYAKINHGAFIKGSETQLTLSFGPYCSSIPDCQSRNMQTYYVYAPFERSIHPEKTPNFSPTFGVGLTGDVWNYGTVNNCGTYFTACDVQSVNDWILVRPGTYILDYSVFNTESASFYVTIDYYEPSPLDSIAEWFNQPAGGLRVHSTIDCADNLSSCKQKVYKYILEDGSSSGVFLGKIDYSYTYTVYSAHDCRNHAQAPMPMPPAYFEYQIPAISYSFRTLNPLEFHAGNPVYYNRVEIYESPVATNLIVPVQNEDNHYTGPPLIEFTPSSSRGMEVQFFKNSTYGFLGSYPYTPIPSDPVNGAVWKTETYSKQQSSFEKIRSIERDNVSATPGLNLSDFREGLVFGISEQWDYVPIDMDATAFTNYLLYNGYRYSKYLVEMPTKLIILNEKDRYYPTDFIKETSYTYNSKLQLKSTTTIDSEGNNRKVQYYYPHEIADPGYTELVAINKINKPVKIEEFIDNTLLQTTQTFYTKWHPNPPIVEVNRIETTQSGTTTVEATVNAVSNAGNLLEVTPREGVKGAFLWGYNQLFPIAQVQNAATGTFAFTSFEEENNKGGWTYTNNSIVTDSKTGVKAHHLNGASITRSGLIPTSSYKLSYWAKGGMPSISAGVQSNNDAPSAEDDGWRYFEKTISGVSSVTISGGTNVWVDEVRLYPKGALMTTYCYKPMFGITSITDPNNRIIYYEYDSKGRLKYVRDHYKNIQTENTYRYKPQTQ